MTTLESFTDLIKGIKFTKPQQEVVNHLLRGDKLITVNQHHQSGGQIMWIRKGDTKPSYAGHVYKAYVGVLYAIKRNTGVEPDYSFFWDSRRNICIS